MLHGSGCWAPMEHVGCMKRAGGLFQVKPEQKSAHQHCTPGVIADAHNRLHGLHGKRSGCSLVRSKQAAVSATGTGGAPVQAAKLAGQVQRLRAAAQQVLQHRARRLHLHPRPQNTLPMGSADLVASCTSLGDSLGTVRNPGTQRRAYPAAKRFSKTGQSACGADMHDAADDERSAEEVWRLV